MLQICFICSLFTQSISGPTSFIKKVGDFGDHPNRTGSCHLSPSRHQNAVRNKQAFKKLSLWQTNIFQLLLEASLATDIQKQKTIWFAIRNVFQMTWVLIRKNWAHTHNLQTLAALARECGGKELQNHLLTSPKNALYMSPD